jgi:hypothetical protein
MSSEPHYIMYYNSDGIIVCGENISIKSYVHYTEYIVPAELTLNVPETQPTQNECIKESKHIPR